MRVHGVCCVCSGCVCTACECVCVCCVFVCKGIVCLRRGVSVGCVEEGVSVCVCVLSTTNRSLAECMGKSLHNTNCHFESRHNSSLSTRKDDVPLDEHHFCHGMLFVC